MKERWSTIDEFENYKVSNYGEILNRSTGRMMRQSHSQSGVLKVGLVNCGVQYTRVVKILVAEAFVFGRTDTFNTAIHLDINQDNVRADNLAWRDRSFACLYSQQFSFVLNNDKPIRDITTNKWYDSIADAAMANGLLIKDIYNSLKRGERTEFTDQIFVWR